MRTVHFGLENANLGPPVGDGGRNVADLPCRRVVIPWQGKDGPALGAAYLSFWKPSERELAALVAGRPIGLMVCGATHPPVTVFVEQDGRLSGEVLGDGAEVQENPVAYPWPEADRDWRQRQAARQVMEDALAGAKDGEG